MKVTLTWLDDDGGEISHEFSAKHEVCGGCDGHGTHLRAAIREHAYTMEEFRESFDEEEAAEYFHRGGRYDVTCETCGGNRVVLVADEDNLSSDDRELFEQYTQAAEEAARDAYTDRRMREAECGYHY
jgi:hypothetical protein